jgi:hypothetical protein
MQFYNTFKSGNGYKTIEFNASEMMSMDLITFFIVGAICTLLAPISVVFLLFVTLYDFENESAKPSIWGALIALYFIIDINCHWLMWLFLQVLEDEATRNLIYTVVVIGFIGHLFLIIFGATVFYNATARKGTLIFATLGLCMILFITIGMFKMDSSTFRLSRGKTQQEKNVVDANEKARHERMQKDFGN